MVAQTQNKTTMFTYYVIPSRINYVQRKEEILSWEKTNKIDPHVPTCVVINDSIATTRLRFVVVYKHKMQYTGGSGTCYNPIQRPSFLTSNADPMDNSKMPAHMRKWIIFDWKYLYELAVQVKYDLLEQIGLKDKLPFFYWDCELYSIPAILAAQLDAVGMGLINPSEVKKTTRHRELKALPCGK